MPSMTDTYGSNTVAEAWDGHNVIAVSFEDDRKAYESLTSLKELDSQKRVGVGEAVVVERGQDGQLVEKDRVESTSLPATASGGLIGLLLGVIGGPLGMLVGGTYGLFAGSLFDLAAGHGIRRPHRSAHRGDRRTARRARGRHLRPVRRLAV